MVIYDLKCVNHHDFEGWFKNPEDFERQKASGLLACPICGTDVVSKKVTASKVGRKSNSAGRSSASAEELAADHKSTIVGEPTKLNNQDIARNFDGGNPSYEQMQALLNTFHRYVDDNFVDVGNKFADEAIKIHRGEKEAENIRGTASKAQLKEMAEEGVSALPLPPRPVNKDKLN